MSNLPSTSVMRRAFQRKDAAFDGTFVVAVKTTGIFCRPVCRAKPPRPQNVEFFRTPDEAIRAGYRPCKLCRPSEQRGAPPAVVSRLIELIDRSAPARVGESDLKSMGVDPSTARRQFRDYCGMTFAAYQRSRRLVGALDAVRNGAAVTAAQVNAGFESGSGFRAAFGRLFGAAASDARGGEVSALLADWIETPLGRMIAVACDEGIAVFDFVDRKGLPAALARLAERFDAPITPAAPATAATPAVRLTPATRASTTRPARTPPTPAPAARGANRHLRQLRNEIGEYFAGKRTTFTVPLSPRGSRFERQAWEYLRRIPFGQTRTYGQQAAAMGAAGAARAVGRANGMNYISIVIPCHRVVGSNGDLTGYGGGLARKRWLLDHERRFAPTESGTANARR